MSDRDGVKAPRLTTRPVLLPLNAASINVELRCIAAWLGYRLAPRDGSWTKQPINLRTSSLAETDNPETWVAFETALRNYRERACAGIGLCRTENLIFIDGDGVLDAQGNVLPFAWARKILSAISGRAYIEKSVTGTGIHGIARGGIAAWPPTI